MTEQEFLTTAKTNFLKSSQTIQLLDCLRRIQKFAHDSFICDRKNEQCVKIKNTTIQHERFHVNHSYISVFKNVLCIVYNSVDAEK